MLSPPTGLWRKDHWYDYLHAQKGNLFRRPNNQETLRIAGDVLQTYQQKTQQLAKLLSGYREDHPKYNITKEYYTFMDDVKIKIDEMRWQALMTKTEWNRFYNDKLHEIDLCKNKKDGLECCKQKLEDINTFYSAQNGHFKILLNEVQEQQQELEKQHGLDSKEYKRKVQQYNRKVEDFKWLADIKTNINDKSEEISTYTFPSEDEDEDEDEEQVEKVVEYPYEIQQMHEDLSKQFAAYDDSEWWLEQKRRAHHEVLSKEVEYLKGLLQDPSAAEQHQRAQKALLSKEADLLKVEAELLKVEDPPAADSGSKPMEESEKSAKSAEPVASSSSLVQDPSDSDDEDPAEKWNRNIRARLGLPPKEPELPPKESETAGGVIVISSDDEPEEPEAAGAAVVPSADESGSKRRKV